MKRKTGFRLLEIGSDRPLKAMEFTGCNPFKPNPYMKDGKWFWYDYAYNLFGPYETEKDVIRDFLDYLIKNKKENTREYRQSQRRIRKI